MLRLCAGVLEATQSRIDLKAVNLYLADCSGWRVNRNPVADNPRYE